MRRVADAGRRWLPPLAVAAGVALLGACTGAEPPAPPRIDPHDEALVALGEQVYAQHCAVCHGADLQGQPDWRRRLPSGRLPAPPHDETGHTWHHPDWELYAMVRDGVTPLAPPDYETDMPAYEDILDDREIRAVLAYIKAQWPEHILEMQEAVNRRQPQPPDGVAGWPR